MPNSVITIGNKKVGFGNPVLIIAEAGVNHNGSLRLARKMVDAAKKAGADAVKFQTYKTEELVTENAPKAEYQKRAVPGKSQFKMLKQYELSEKAFRNIQSYCRKKKIIFLSTPFDYPSARLLKSINIPAFKISSGDLNNTPFLTEIARYKKPMIISTGMSVMDEIKKSVKAIFSTGNRKLVLMHCTSNYPVKFDEVNLRVINEFKNKFKIPIGFSDHSEGVEASVAAVALGASVIEKHFTLNKKMKGPDHKASLDTKELVLLVKSIRNVEKAFGKGIKAVQPSERPIQKVVRKSIVASCFIPKGTIIKKEMLSIKRPGTGLEPGYISRIMGRKAGKNIEKNSLIKKSDIL